MNEQFLNRMKDLLGDRYEEYVATLDLPPYKGFRINTLKISEEEFFERFPLRCHHSPFASDAYVLDEDTLLGNSLAHRLGLMYLQEPSAASAVEVLDPKPGDYILDLCAAPGSKSTQIAVRMKGEGLLVSNEYDHKRAQVLLSNIERLGIGNAVVTNATVDRLCPILEESMDKVLVDAPCSGEGMFRKEDEALANWSVDNVLACARRQKFILNEAYKSLKKDGIMVYSTCTYSKEENEEVIAWFLDEHPDMELLPIEVSWGTAGSDMNGKPTHYCRRIFPMDKGEGHFVARMVKHGGSSRSLKQMKSERIDETASMFLKSMSLKDYKYQLYTHDRFYVGDQPFWHFGNINLLRNQILVGEVVKGRFEPHHHFFTCLAYDDALNKVDISEEECELFMKGNTIARDTRGYQAVYCEKQAVGFGKGDGSIIKNKYPKGLRR